MPQLIRTPEDIFRDERRDVFALYFKQEDEDSQRATREEMSAWFAQHMPDSPTETMAPSEHSGFIMGGPMALRVALTDADLQLFCEHWETPEGQSIDPRFQCYQMRYQDWWTQHGCHQPTLEQPQGPGVSVWIETPLGILSHVLPKGQDPHHPAKPRDIWANACERWPQLQAHDLDDLNHGQVVWASHQNNWLMLFNESFKDMGQIPEAHWHTVADWLRLPADVQISPEF